MEFQHYFGIDANLKVNFNENYIYYLLILANCSKIFRCKGIGLADTDEKSDRCLK